MVVRWDETAVQLYSLGTMAGGGCDPRLWDLLKVPAMVSACNNGQASLLEAESRTRYDRIVSRERPNGLDHASCAHE